MTRIKKDDKVVVIAGKDKGKQGTVLKVLPSERVLVDGINMVKKHVKPNPQKNEVGGVVEKEKSIHISNVAIFNVEKNSADRIKYIFNDSGKKVRVFASTKELIDL